MTEHRRFLWASLLTAVSLVALSIALSRPAKAEMGDKYEMLGMFNPGERVYSRHAVRSSVVIVGGRPHGAPRAYCGFASALKIGLNNAKGQWNLARNWFAFPRSTPGPGKALVRRNHVAIIIGGGPGAYKIWDPNSGGGLTRIYVTAQLRGVVVDPSAGRVR